MQTKEIMYSKNIYYTHKIIYLLVLLFKDPNILLLTLLFVYTLPCFHPVDYQKTSWAIAIASSHLLIY
jgi:hypothetical protein